MHCWKVFTSAMILATLFCVPLPALAADEVRIVSLHGGAFCSDLTFGAPAPEFEDQTDKLFDRSAVFASKSDSCPATCAPAINQAAYCEFGAAVTQEKVNFDQIFQALSGGQILFDKAAASERLAIEILADTLSLFGREALSQLANAEEALSDNSPEKLNGTSWALSMREIEGYASLLKILNEVELADDAINDLSLALDFIAQEMTSLGDEITVALTRAQIMQPETKDELQARIGVASEKLKWVIDSLNASAAHAVRQANSTMNTDANAVPASSDTIANLEASVCFSSLALSASLSAEASTLTHDLSASCRTFDPCTNNSNFRPIGPGLIALLDFQGRLEKQTFAVTSSMCVPG